MQIKTCFATCPKCQGNGKNKSRIKKSVRLRYEVELARFEKSSTEEAAPLPPKAHFSSCSHCSGSGLTPSENFPVFDVENLPHVAIIGAGIGGVALAVACLHRGIPFTIFERDTSFNERSQGYGLTLQQASKVIDGFGIFSIDNGIVSTRHLVHTTDGTVIAEWGMRKWLQNTSKPSPKKTNIHIARQSLRFAFIEQLGGPENIKWGHRLVDFKETQNNVNLKFLVNGVAKTAKADLIVGADGIRSAVRNILIGEEISPLRYLDCIVILGICSLSALENKDYPLLDGATVFQTANGNERIYMMPFDSDSVMWQLSFPMSEKEAKKLSVKGAEALKKEASRRTQWHAPVPQIIAATLTTHISGYPVYDRELLSSELLNKAGKATLIGDAAHPMSPFKGQGANQALLDALSLAREISKQCKALPNWRKTGIRETVLPTFEAEMLERSAVKVEDSAAAAQFLHSEIALYKGNEPRGKVLKRKKS